MKQALFILLFSISTFVISQNKVEAPKIAIKIMLGETIQIENHSITFLEVLEDSRCPQNVSCIWGGRAIVTVKILKEGQNSIQKELLFGATKPNETPANTMLFSTEKFAVKGYTLRPYPTSEIGKEKEAYSLLIVRKKAE
jgi:hypothetical protein